MDNVYWPDGTPLFWDGNPFEGGRPSVLDVDVISLFDGITVQAVSHAAPRYVRRSSAASATRRAVRRGKR